MKFVYLLHESELQVTELTEYKGTDLQLGTMFTLITQIHTYIRLLPQVVLNTKYTKV